MIEKASELLEEFIKIEKMALDEVDMPHMPTLGSAYEEITKQGIEQDFAIPAGLGLKVVSGFISVGEEMLPQQIDGMLVCGDGKQYGRTKEFIYPIDQVLCIFEVKKTLNKSDYIDAFDHLRLIRQKYTEYFESKLEDPTFEPDIVVARKHFSQITGREAPTSYRHINSLPKADGILFYSLVQETLAPLSIIHGYGGYTTESGMRNAFLDILFEKGEISGEGLGIPSLPALVTTNGFSIVKGNGVPFIGITEEREWAALLSIKGNSARIILEIIWSKIALYFDVSMPWGEDSKTESAVPLMYAAPKEIGDAAGWEYTPLRFKESVLKGRDDVKEWQPVEIDKDITSVVYTMLGYGGYIHVDDVAEISGSHSVDSQELLDRIINTLLFKQVGDYIRPISNILHMATDANDKNYLSSSRERLDIWCDNNGISKSYMNLFIME
ncbi:hypothetical protein GNP84_19795 [Aliivibrio fischeri]|uniref:DUF6602 domain-containing protein n=1 Tax=Aliivibrio fischeri TaxID=668 RepID=UPI0012D87E6B|nr:DUF6602 domain-containing protein [Aliivibrio fischeri]MUK79118.1 hypothetical protein [Aliivibrio fischeri]